MEDMNRIVSKSTVKALTIGEAIRRLTQLVVSGVPESSILNCPAKRASEIAALLKRVDSGGTITASQADEISKAATTFWVEYVLEDGDLPGVASDSLPSKNSELTRAIEDMFIADESDGPGVFVSDAYNRYKSRTLATGGVVATRDAFKFEVYRQGYVLEYGRLPGVKLV